MYLAGIFFHYLKTKLFCRAGLAGEEKNAMSEVFGGNRSALEGLLP
jgi:hypothetical protein